MNHDLYVLRALARLSRQRKTVDDESLVIRAGGTTEEVRAALGRLAGDGLIAWPAGNGQAIRLTLSGLAVAVASSATSRASRAPLAARSTASAGASSTADLHLRHPGARARPSRRRAA